MLKDGRYYPSDDDRKLFRRIITVVRTNPGWFVTNAAELDREYSTQAIRDRMAADLRVHRANPDHTKRSRAHQRKHCHHEALSQWLGSTVTPIEAVPGPPKRLRGADDKPQQPRISLQERFLYAFKDTYEDEVDFSVHALQEGVDMAAKRVLLAWLRLDPDRDSIRRITEFQALRNTPTEDGIQPFLIPDDEDLSNRDDALFIRRDGGMGRFATTWIRKAQDAIEFLESQIDPTGDSHRPDNHASDDAGEAIQQALSNPEQTKAPNAAPDEADLQDANLARKTTELRRPTHSPDFTSVDWYGARYTFAKGNQARSVQALWEAWEAGGHSLTQETIGDRIRSAADRFELRTTFRRRKEEGGYEPHPAWGTMIQKDGKGCYRLVSPESA